MLSPSPIPRSPFKAKEVRRTGYELASGSSGLNFVVKTSDPLEED